MIAERVLGLPAELSRALRSSPRTSSLFRDAVRELLEKECTPAHVRAAWDSTSRSIARAVGQARRMGVVGLTVPEAHGGLGLDEVDLVLILEETGRAALPEPLLETTAVGAPLFARRRRARPAPA